MQMMLATPELAAQAERMRAAFLDRLGDRVLEIDMLLREMDRDGALPDLRAAIALRAHKTAGVAPTYGYVALGDMARAVEEAWSTGYARVGDTAAAALTAVMLDEMERLLDEALPGAA